MSSDVAEPRTSAPQGAGSDASVAGPRSSFVWGRRILLANLVAQIGIVVTGGLVRLTGSGLGCPTWPQCVPGSYTPTVTQPQGWHKQVEFGNRLLTFVLVIVAVAVFAVALQLASRFPQHRRRVLWFGALPFLGIVAQAVLGGITVLTNLSPPTVAAHFLLSMVLVAASTWMVLRLTPEALARREADATAAPVRREIRVLVRAIAVLAGVVLVLGTVVTGSGPHSGDAEKPARTGLDPATMSWIHADAVWLFVGLVVALLVALRLVDAAPALRRRANGLLHVTLLQGVIGYVQYATGLPILAVALHMLGASLLVVAVTRVVEGTGVRVDLTPTANDTAT